MYIPNPLTIAVNIWNLLVKFYDLLKFVKASITTVGSAILTFLAAAGAGLMALVMFWVDASSKLADFLAGKGAMGAYAAAAMSGDLQQNITDIPISSQQAIIIEWIGFVAQYIPFNHIFNVFAGLVTVLIYAAMIRTTKAFIPTIA
jgi:hypothetical protein